MENNILLLRPRFQRNLVWNDNHKENFIDTILRGLPFPEIYIASGEMDLEKMISTIVIVDGQQRLSTIRDYINGSEDFVFKRILRFDELIKEQKTDFLDYDVVVRNLGRIDEDLIKEIFSRINSVQYALNAMEINNALYEGEFITTAKRICESSNLNKLEVFSESQQARMDDINFILLIMTTIEAGGYFSLNKEVEEYIQRMDNEYSNKDATIADLMSVIELVVNLNLEKESIWLRRSSLFTLLIELVWYKRKTGWLPDSRRLLEMLNDLHKKILDNRDKDIQSNRYAQFYNYMSSGTSNATARRVRGELLREVLYSI
jgi:hypothetical protein